MKKSFVLHNDSLLILDDLTNEEAGQLFKAIAAFNCGKELDLERGIRMLFLPFKNQFIRDNANYIGIVERNSINGSKGGRPKTTQDNPNNPGGLNETEKTQMDNSKPKKADSDSDSDKGSDKGSDNDNEKGKESTVDFLLLQFDNFRKQYPGTKLGNETEFSNFKKKHKDFLAVLPNLETAIKNQIKHKEQLKSQGKFIPEWKNLSTWINQRCWEEEIETATQTKKQMVY